MFKEKEWDTSETRRKKNRLTLMFKLSRQNLVDRKKGGILVI